MHQINIIVFNDDGTFNIPNHLILEANKSVMILFRAVQGNTADRNEDRKHYDSICGMSEAEIDVIAKEIDEQETRYSTFIEETKMKPTISID